MPGGFYDGYSEEIHGMYIFGFIKNIMPAFASVMDLYFRKHGVNIDKADVLIIPVNVHRNGV